MKQLIMAIITFLFLVSVQLANCEGTKQYSFPDKTVELTLMVPEMFPEFFAWDGRVLGMERFSNGRSIMLIEHGNAESDVWVLVLLLRESSEKLFIISTQVSYFLPGWKDAPKPEELIKTEYYIDQAFMLSGVPSNILGRAENSPDWENLKSNINRSGI